MKKCFALHEEVIDIFHNKFYIPTLEYLSFHLSNAYFFGSMQCGKTRNEYFLSQ